MIELTEKAVAQVLRLRNEQAIPPDKSLRIFVEPGGCSGLEYGMGFDAARDDDERIETGGITVLLDPQCRDLLRGSRVDFDDGLTGKGFDIQNPNAGNTCGCGKSFN